MLLEGAEAFFERMEHRLCQLRGLARVKHVLEDYALAKDMALQQDAPVPEPWICGSPVRETRAFLALWA
jgi:hypothetical protein